MRSTFRISLIQIFGNIRVSSYFCNIEKLWFHGVIKCCIYSMNLVRVFLPLKSPQSLLQASDVLETLKFYSIDICTKMYDLCELPFVFNFENINWPLQVTSKAEAWPTSVVISASGTRARISLRSRLALVAYDHPRQYSMFITMSAIFFIC